jgi:23S rRNA pseudouridine1911/1915/1917 synthase
LDAQIAGHGMHKRYLAVVEGRLDTRGAWRTIDVPLGRDRHDARRMRASKTGKPSQTRIRTLALGRAESLILAELETGRRHQIRVHLAHLGHPIKGDTLYNKRAVSKGDRSQLMLHAWREQLIHPVTKETLRFEAPAPSAFARLFPEVELP